MRPNRHGPSSRPVAEPYGSTTDRARGIPDWVTKRGVVGRGLVSRFSVTLCSQKIKPFESPLERAGKICQFSSPRVTQPLGSSLLLGATCTVLHAGGRPTVHQRSGAGALSDRGAKLWGGAAAWLAALEGGFTHARSRAGRSGPSRQGRRRGGGTGLAAALRRQPG